MPTTVELIGRRFGKAGAVRQYIVKDATDEDAAVTSLLAEAPEAVGGYQLTGYEGAEDTAEGHWKATVTYGLGDALEGSGGSGEEPDTGDLEFHFEIAVAPARIYLPPKGSKIIVYGPDGVHSEDDPSPHVIGDTGDPEVDPSGAEIFEPSMEFSKTYYNAAANITTAYINTIGALVGTLNDDEFAGFAAGEVLAKGVHGSRRSVKEDWQIDYRFAVKRHQTGLNVGGVWVPGEGEEPGSHTGGVTYDKKGWQYVWPITKMARIYEGGGGWLTRQVQFVCLSDLYTESDFSLFGIGT
jgi:hypothetical protein